MAFPAVHLRRIVSLVRLCLTLLAAWSQSPPAVPAAAALLLGGQRIYLLPVACIVRNTEPSNPPSH
jgi:hypothetical protein